MWKTTTFDSNFDAGFPYRTYSEMGLGFAASLCPSFPFFLFLSLLLSQIFTVLTVTVSNDVTDEAPDKF